MRYLIVATALLAGCSGVAAEPVAAPATVTETVTVTAEPEPAETVTVTVTEVETVVETAPAARDAGTAYQVVRDTYQDQLNRQPSLDELQWGVESVIANGEAQWLAVFAREYAAESEFAADKERAEQSRESVQGGVDTMSCMSNPDAADCG